MALAVRYSLRARPEEIELLEYVVRKFGQQKAKEIYVNIEKTLDRISESPKIFRESAHSICNPAPEKRSAVMTTVTGKEVFVIGRRQKATPARQPSTVGLKKQGVPGSRTALWVSAAIRDCHAFCAPSSSSRGVFLAGAIRTLTL